MVEVERKCIDIETLWRSSEIASVSTDAAMVLMNLTFRTTPALSLRPLPRNRPFAGRLVKLLANDRYLEGRWASRTAGIGRKSLHDPLQAVVIVGFGEGWLSTLSKLLCCLMDNESLEYAVLQFITE